VAGVTDRPPRPDRPKPASGVVLVDKPLGITSHDVVSLVRRAAGTRKVGHAGTLDPLATGLLLLGLESSTRLLTYLVGLDKDYTATIRLGESTTTDDAAGETIEHVDASGLRRADIDAGIARLTGEIEQVPSTFSAIKVDGRRAYDLARNGEEVQLRSRRVTVDVFEVLEERRLGRAVELDVRVTVSSGTYVRALARDLGADLGVGGHLIALRRTRIGPFSVDDAVAPDDEVLRSRRDPAEVATALYPGLALDETALGELMQGKRPMIAAPGDPLADAEVVAALTPSGRLAGLVQTTGGQARVLVNFPTTEVLA
jgi:tRNA pseudouridine55 synthase